jgi:general secretion pathway protein G
MRRNTTGFTLVEILIVVIILGILAAIVIPQFTEASNDARRSAVLSDLQTVRSQIELYKVQHHDNYPTASIKDQLTELTDANGDTGTDPNVHVYGPYLKTFPKNPAQPAASADSVKTTGSAGSGSEGWWYDPSTGEFRANDSTYKDL